MLVRYRFYSVFLSMIWRNKHTVKIMLALNCLNSILSEYFIFFSFFFLLNLEIAGTLSSFALSEISAKTKLNFLGFCGSPANCFERKCWH